MKLNKRVLLLASLGLALLLALVGLAGCVSQTPALGWSGMIFAGDNLFTNTMQGRLLVLNLASGTQQQTDLEPPSGGGFLGCAGPAFGVASYGMPAAEGDNIYLTGYNGKVYRYATATGTLTSTPLGGANPQSIVGGVVASGGKLYVASADGSLYALDGQSLNQLWSFKTRAQIWSTPALDDGTLYIGSFDKRVYAVDAATGQEKWSYATQGAVVATPVVANGRVYVASFDRQVYALDAASGQLVWKFPTAGAPEAPASWFWANPVLAGDILLAPCMDHYLYALRAQDGSLAYKLDLKAPLIANPLVAGNQAIVVNENGTIYAFEAATGQGLKSVDLRQADNPNTKNLKVHAALAAAGGRVYVHTMSNEYIYAVDPAALAVSQVWDAATAVVSTPTVTTVTAPPSVITVTATVTTGTK